MAHRGVAEAAGWREVTGYIPGMGTHHVRGGITPAMLADPAFNPANPILDSVGLDTVFDPTKPDVLQFDGAGASARLVGFDYYVRTTTGLPPAGFPGNNDWWHHHPMICHRKTDAAMIAVQHHRRELHLAGWHQRQPVELLHAPRLGPRRHEVHPGRVRWDDALHHRRLGHPRPQPPVPHHPGRDGGHEPRHDPRGARGHVNQALIGPRTVPGQDAKSLGFTCSGYALCGGTSPLPHPVVRRVSDA